MDVKELRRAYATLGLDDHATLAQARDAYLIWAALLGEPFAPESEETAQAAARTTADLSHHELDLAWHAIEQAHEHGVLFPRRPRGCQQCAATPAVRVTLHSVAPGGFRARVTAHNALLCRTCGLEAYARVQRETRRRGWWGVLAPFANLRAMMRNSTEKAFLRRVEPNVPRQSRRGVRRSEARRSDVRAGRATAALLTALAVIAIIVGVVFPGGNVPPQVPSSGTGSVAASVTGK